MALKDVLAVILGGGQGTRLRPLTTQRAKPAVPIGGKHRLIDIPISNCLNSDIHSIYVLTQFLSASLHRHIYQTYKVDMFSGGFVYILAAQQTGRTGTDWYQGTADAVRKQLNYLVAAGVQDILILSGDHLYRMDYGEFVAYHRETRADITIAVQPVTEQAAPRLGILQTDVHGCVRRFVEKPQPEALRGLESQAGGDKPYLASMGIYVFRASVLAKVLEENDAEDFGRQIIPAAIDRYGVYGYPFDGYWEDIGTIRSFYEANLALASPNPAFDFYDEQRPIYTRPRFLPSTRADGCKLDRTLLAEGCRLLDAEIADSVIGLRTFVDAGTRISHSVCLGADYYENDVETSENERLKRPGLGIGPRCHIEGAIIDKNVRIGAEVTIRPRAADAPDEDGDGYVVRDGIVAIPKNTVIPDGTVI